MVEVSASTSHLPEMPSYYETLITVNIEDASALADKIIQQREAQLAEIYRQEVECLRSLLQLPSWLCPIFLVLFRVMAAPATLREFLQTRRGIDPNG